MVSPISLRVLGEEFVDFKSARVSYGIEAFARSFSFTFSDKWLRTLVRPLPFQEGDECQVLVHGQPVVDGFIDDIPIRYDAQSHEIEITGRSWSGHMVDASAEFPGGSWKLKPLPTIATDLATPYGVAVAVDPWAAADVVEPFKKYGIEDEETAYACMQRAAERRGVFLTSGFLRDVKITKASPVVHPGLLKLGANVLNASRTGRFSERFSHYIVKSQAAGSETFFGPAATGPFVRVQDTGVTPYRPLIMVADGYGNAAELNKRASWERNVRAGRSRRLTYGVQGLLSPLAKVPWPSNELITVDDPYFDQVGLLLIAAVSLSYGPQGEVATLELAHPSAFDVLIPPAKKKKGQKGFLSLL